MANMARAGRRAHERIEDLASSEIQGQRSGAKPPEAGDFHQLCLVISAWNKVCDNVLMSFKSWLLVYTCLSGFRIGKIDRWPARVRVCNALARLSELSSYRPPPPRIATAPLKLTILNAKLLIQCSLCG
jgi:hypothetical protein